MNSNEKNSPEAQLRSPQILEMKTVPFGQNGLDMLLQSEKTVSLDEKIKSGRPSDLPSGPPLIENSRTVGPEQRTEEYKQSILSLYRQSAEKIKRYFLDLSNGKNVVIDEIRGISEKFVDVFTKDNNILLHISTIKSEEEEYLYHHSLNVCLLSIVIAAAAGYGIEQTVEIAMGALLHDIGMLSIRKDIRFRKGPLSEEEVAEIRKHPILGLYLLDSVKPFPTSIPYIIYQCHERSQGTGYPKGYGQNHIHRFAKIVQIADIYEAASSPRPYREEYMPYKAAEIVIKMTSRSLLCGEFTKCFLSRLSLFPVGSIVELSDRKLAKVTRGNAQSFAKPLVTVFAEKSGQSWKNISLYEIDLSTNTDLSIQRAYKSDYMGKIGILDGI